MLRRPLGLNSTSNGRWGEYSRDDVSAGEGQSMEQGECRVGHEDEGDRLRKEPKDGKRKVLEILISNGLLEVARSWRRHPKGFVDHDRIAHDGPNKGSLIPDGESGGMKREPADEVSERGG